MIGSYLYIQTTVKLQCLTTVSFVVSGLGICDKPVTSDHNNCQHLVQTTEFRIGLL